MANLDLLNEFWKRSEQEATFRSFAPTLRRARPFTLDAELAELVSQLSEANPKALRNFLHSARLPYPIMWIEADFKTAFRHKADPIAPWHLTIGDPIRIGWLVAESPPGSGIYTATRIATVPSKDEPDNIGAALYPNVQMFSPFHPITPSVASFESLRGQAPEGVFQAMRDFNEAPHTALLAWRNDEIMHTQVDGLKDYIDAANEAAMESPLYQTNATLLHPLFIEQCETNAQKEGDTIYNMATRMMRSGAVDQAGDLGFIVAALALMNEVPVRYVPYRPSGSMRFKGGLRPYMTSSIVSIDVPATRRRLKDIESHLKNRGRELSRRARHEVRGYFRWTDKLPATNPERWERAIDRNGKYRWRTWIEHHERGDAALGWVHQTYRVTKRQTSKNELAAA